MDNNQNNDPNNININLNEMIAAGVYCNLALVNHSPSEFVVDFIQLMLFGSLFWFWLLSMFF